MDQFGKSLHNFITATVKLECRSASASTFDTIEDAIGDSLLEVWQKLATFDSGKSKFTTWVTMIVLRNVIDIYRKYNKQKEIEYIDSYYNPKFTLERYKSTFVGEGEFKTQQSEQKDFVNAIIDQTQYSLGINNQLILEKLLNKLNGIDKLFIMKKLEGLSEVELADHFGQNPKWAKNKWYRLAEKLRLLMVNSESLV